MENLLHFESLKSFLLQLIRVGLSPQHQILMTMVSPMLTWGQETMELGRIVLNLYIWKVDEKAWMVRQKWILLKRLCIKKGNFQGHRSPLHHLWGIASEGSKQVVLNSYLMPYAFTLAQHTLTNILLFMRDNIFHWQTDFWDISEDKSNAPCPLVHKFIRMEPGAQQDEHFEREFSETLHLESRRHQDWECTLEILNYFYQGNNGILPKTFGAELLTNFQKFSRAASKGHQKGGCHGNKSPPWGHRERLPKSYNLDTVFVPENYRVNSHITFPSKTCRKEIEGLPFLLADDLYPPNHLSKLSLFSWNDYLNWSLMTTQFLFYGQWLPKNSLPQDCTFKKIYW